jgi:hypothetical protein
VIGGIAFVIWARHQSKVEAGPVKALNGQEGVFRRPPLVEAGDDMHQLDFSVCEGHARPEMRSGSESARVEGLFDKRSKGAAESANLSSIGLSHPVERIRL